MNTWTIRLSRAWLINAWIFSSEKIQTILEDIVLPIFLPLAPSFMVKQELKMFSFHIINIACIASRHQSFLP